MNRYTPYKEEHWDVDCDPMESESDLDKFIENKRREFYDEWFEYIAQYED